MIIVKIDSTSVDSLGRRIAKFLGFGKKDVRTAAQVGPYGVDANPIPGMRAIYSKSSVNGKDVVIGYINMNAVAEVGEHRIFSTNNDGTVQTYVHLKNDGVMLLGGDADFGVRYSKLEEAFNQLKDDHNSLVDKFNLHVHSGVQTGGGSSAVPTTTETASTANIAPAKIETIKTP